MPPNLLSTGILILAFIVYLYACKVLIDDARVGYSFTMGAEMYFSQLWIIASLLGVTGAIRLFALSWWLFLPAVVMLYFLSLPLRRAINNLFHGRGLEPSKPTGFKAFEQKLKDQNGPSS